MKVSAAVTVASRDAHVTLRRVERQQHLVTILCRQGKRRTLQELAYELGVTPRTVSRDIRRLRDSGVPISVTAGPTGGASLEVTTEPRPVRLDLAEIAALISSLTAVGPTASEPAQSAMTKLVTARSDTRNTDAPVMSTNAPG